MADDPSQKQEEIEKDVLDGEMDFGPEAQGDFSKYSILKKMKQRDAGPGWQGSDQAQYTEQTHRKRQEPIVIGPTSTTGRGEKSKPNPYAPYDAGRQAAQDAGIAAGEQDRDTVNNF